ncbi:unnamed protein product [Urochloa decumbens]|uniref:PGG domain-containing protein n=1 Tax=Urochloa decumbens TaxID=240449 RepID=A0ABC8VJB4_9POAL
MERTAAGGDPEQGVDHDPPAPPAAGALLKGVTPDGDTALHAAAGNGDDDDYLKFAGIICDRDRELLFAKNHMGDTPLHCAAGAGRYKMVSHLIALAGCEGADTDSKLKLLRMDNERHETALHKAVWIEDGSSLDDKDIRRPGYKDDADGGGKAEEDNMVKLLMDADPELAKYPAEGISPLYLAILLEKDTIAVTLYEKSGGNLSYSGPDGQTALHLAVLRITNAVMMKLLEWNKSLIAQVDKHGSTPLHFASSLRHNHRDIRIFNRIAQEFPDSAGLRNAKGRTFLHVAVEKRRREIVSFVCQTPSAEWILNMQDKNGNTALHLAIKRNMLKTCYALLGNKKVLLNLSNVKGHTPLDLSRRNLPRRIYYKMIPESQIHSALISFGAEHSVLRRDHIEGKYGRPLNQKEKNEQSDLINNATQMFIVGAVLIATVAFGATFAIPGGYKADDHLNGGTPTLAGRYTFDAFMMANTLAFVCSTVATLGLVLSGTTLFDLRTRKMNFIVSVSLFSSSVTSMTVAFALAAYMVLAPVARSTAIAIFIISPVAVLYRNLEKILKLRLLARAQFVRKGPISAMQYFVGTVIFLIMWELWPVIVTFAWAGFARIHHG